MFEKAKNIIKAYRGLIDNTRGQIELVKKNEMYSDEYKEQLQKGLIAEFEKRQQELREQMSNYIQSQMAEVEEKHKHNDKGFAYDIKLNNALKLLELAGSSMTDKEITNLLGPFNDDLATMQLIRRVLENLDKGHLVEADVSSNMFMLQELERVTNEMFVRDFESAGSDLLRVEIAVQMLEKSAS